MSIFQTLLIDADILAFKVAAKSETKLQWPGQGPQWDPMDWEYVKPYIHDVLDAWVKGAGGGNPMICLSAPSSGGWRVNQVLPSYKGNRKDTRKPHWLADVKQYLEDNFPSYRRPTLEADDIMGILATDPTLVPGKKVIVSSDKDMLTIPSWVCNPDTGHTRRVPVDEANWWHLYQTIVGDTTDGYQGCPGVGPVFAWKALDADLGDYSGADAWAAVVDLYESKGFTEEDALVQARVARICRASDYDFKNKEVILWTPSTAT